jgi:hypothetical protein
MTAVDHTVHAAVACPGCTGIDQSQRVPEVYRSGISGYSGTGWAAGIAAGQPAAYRTVHSGSIISNTAAALEPRPTLTSHRGTAMIGTFLLLCAAAFAIVMIQAGAHTSWSGLANSAKALLAMLFYPACFGLIGAALLIPSFRAHRWRQQVARGMPRTYDVWQRAWYCHRCGGVYFPPTEASLGLPTGRLLTTPEFRHLLRHVGGFNHVS